MTLYDLFLCVAATWGSLHVWFNGSIFAGSRAYLEALSENAEENWELEFQQGYGYRCAVIWWFSELMTCPLCLSVWCSFSWVMLRLYPNVLSLDLPIFTLATLGLVNFINEYLTKDNHDRT